MLRSGDIGQIYLSNLRLSNGGIYKTSSFCGVLKKIAFYRPRSWHFINIIQAVRRGKSERQKQLDCFFFFDKFFL